ncbi:MAG TPA: hypothetical protein VIE44_20790 [Methylomirabilota bacterium]
MTRRQFGEVVAGLGAAAALPSALARAEDPAPAAREQQAVENCLQLIRNCQRPDGAFNMRLEREPSAEEDRQQARADGEDPAAVYVDTIRVVPYFANHSALALLSGHARHARNVEDVKRAARWIAFYAREQSQTTGYITDFKGSRSRGTFFSNGQMDSVDAYASTLLQVADRHWTAVSVLAPAEQRELATLLPTGTLVQAAALSLRAIESVTDRDGLTWARPDYRVKFLLDSAEVYGGLRAGESLFARVGARSEAARARQLAGKLGPALGQFWQKEPQRFAWAITADGARQDGFTDSYPHALANLAALAWISGESRALWRALQSRFAPDIHAPVERWLMAAIGVADGDVGAWRQRAVDEALRCTARTNGQRTALLVLALCEGRSWMPSVAEERGRR